MRVESAEEKKPSNVELCFCTGILVSARDHELQHYEVARGMVDKVVDWLLNIREEEENGNRKSA